MLQFICRRKILGKEERICEGDRRGVGTCIKLYRGGIYKFPQVVQKEEMVLLPLSFRDAFLSYLQK